MAKKKGTPAKHDLHDADQNADFVEAVMRGESARFERALAAKENRTETKERAVQTRRTAAKQQREFLAELREAERLARGE